MNLDCISLSTKTMNNLLNLSIYVDSFHSDFLNTKIPHKTADVVLHKRLIIATNANVLNVF